jgi:hypothetical protein
MNTTRRTVEKLARHLDLPLPDPYSQDWEYEVADSTKVADFLKVYGSGHLAPDEQSVLFNIIIGSYNYAISQNTARPEDWNLISSYLLRDRADHEAIINYWSLPDEVDLENCFPITPLIRKLIGLC